MKNKNYTNLALSVETHTKLKEYCKENAYSIIGLLTKLINEEIKKSKNKQ